MCSCVYVRKYLNRLELFCQCVVIYPNEVQCHTTVLGYLVTTLDIPWLNSKLDIIPSNKDKPKYMYSFQVECATYIGVCLYEVLLMTYLVFFFLVCLVILLKAINQF